MTDQSNQRKYYRINVDIPIRFCIYHKGETRDNGTKCFEARTRDISVGGLQITMDRLIEELFLIDTYVRVDMNLPGTGVKLELTATPRKIHSIDEDTDTHPIRMEFNEVTDEQMSIIRNFIEKHKE